MIAPNRVLFEAEEGHTVMYGLAIFQTVDANGGYRLETSFIGTPPSSARIGLLQSVLDHEREEALRTWKPVYGEEEA